MGQTPILQKKANRLMKASWPVVLVSVFVVLTVFLVFQFWGLVISNNSFNRDYSRDIIAQVRLKSIQFTVDSDAISMGYFVSNLTFENPTSEKLTLAGVHGEYYYRNSSTGGGWKIADGWIGTGVPLVLSPGSSSQMALQMELEPYAKQDPSFAIVSSYNWMIYYRPKLAYISYQMLAIVTDSAIQYESPSYASDEIYTVADTYVSSIVSAWIFGFEIVAVSLIRKERAQKTNLTFQGEKHSLMLSIIYALQGLGIIAVLGYRSVLNVLIPPPPVDYIPYGLHGVAGLAGGILLLEVSFVALVFLVVAVGLFFRKNWAREAAIIISLLAISILLLGGLLAYNSALGILFSTVAAGHGVVVYVLTSFKLPKRLGIKPR